MNDATPNNINDADIEYSIVVKNHNDIISELTDDATEKLIYESIIGSLESVASKTVKNKKIAQLPSIGCIRINPLREVIKSNHVAFKIAKKNMNSEQYKSHVKEIIIDARQTMAINDARKLAIKRIRSKNKKRYDLLYINIGKAYAEVYILSLLLLRVVPYDDEVQQHLEELNKL